MGKGRAPCCDKSQVKRGPWSPAEDMKLVTFVQNNGHENWRALPKQAGLLRCGKSCRLRWINYLRPDVKRGNFTKEEEDTIINLHQTLGNKWSKIASHLPGRTDNEIKNVWNTHLKKRLALKTDAENIPNGLMDHELPKESSTTSSSSTSTGTIVMSSGQMELGDQWDDHIAGSMPKRTRVSYNTQELISSSSISSSNATNSSQVDDSKPDEETRIGAQLMEFGGGNCHHDAQNSLDEVNKPEFQGSIEGEELLLELDFDFWNMLDSLASSFQSNDQLVQSYGNIVGAAPPRSNVGDYHSGENDNKMWLCYLEKELLGLEATNNKDGPSQENLSQDIIAAVHEPLVPDNFRYGHQLPTMKPGSVDSGNGNYNLLWPCL